MQDDITTPEGVSPDETQENQPSAENTGEENEIPKEEGKNPAPKQEKKPVKTNSDFARMRILERENAKLRGKKEEAS